MRVDLSCGKPTRCLEANQSTSEARADIAKAHTQVVDFRAPSELTATGIELLHSNTLVAIFVPGRCLMTKVVSARKKSVTSMAIARFTHRDLCVGKIRRAHSGDHSNKGFDYKR